MKENAFTCIGRSQYDPAVPATPDEWRSVRESQQVSDLCRKIAQSTSEEEIRLLKAKLPVWTPRSAGFKANHRKESELERPLQRLMLDIDEKGHSQDIMALLRTQDGEHYLGPYLVLLVEESIRRGTHVMVALPDAVSPQEVQDEFTRLTGLKVDPAVKNAAGCIYQVPHDHTLLLSPKLFDPDFTPTPLPEASVQRSSLPAQPSSPDEAPAQRSSLDAQRPSPSSLAAFDLCAKQAGLNPKSMDVWGEHNWHNNLMAVLSVGVTKLMSRQVLEAVIRERVPRYAETEDCRKLVAYFYEKYSADKGYMSQQLRSINAEMQRMQATSEAQDQADAMALTKGWRPPALPDRLPRVLQLATDYFEGKYREMLAMACLPVLSAHASHFRAEYLSGKEIGPNTFVAIIGGSGKGKGQCTDLQNMLVSETLLKNDEEEWAKVDQNSKLRDQKENAKDRPAKYFPKFRMIQTCSKSSIIKLQSMLGDNGMLLGQFSEVDQLFKSTTQAYSDISVILRKAWDGDREQQYYLSEQSANVNCKMNMSLLMAGTVKAMLCRMFKDVENGMMQRCIPMVVPLGQRTFRPPRQNRLKPEEKAELLGFMKSLYLKDLALGSGTCKLELPKTCKIIEQFFDSVEQRYRAGLLGEAEADLSHRCGEFIMRAAIPLVALEGEETKEILEFALWVGLRAHYNLCQIFASRVARDLAEAREMISDSVTTDARKTSEPYLDMMPEVFTLDEFRKLRSQHGQLGDCKPSLSRYCKLGILERIGRGLYRKVGPATTLPDLRPTG